VFLAYPLPLGEEGSASVSPGGRIYRLELRRDPSPGRLRFGPETEVARHLGVEGRWSFRERDPLPGLLPPSCRRLAFWLAANCLASRPLSPGRLVELLASTDREASFLSSLLLGGAVRARRTPGGLEVRFRRLPPSLALFRVSLEDPGTDRGKELPWPPRSRFDPLTLSRCWGVPPPRPFAWLGRKSVLYWREEPEKSSPAEGNRVLLPLRPGPAARVMVQAG